MHDWELTGDEIFDAVTLNVENLLKAQVRKFAEWLEANYQIVNPEHENIGDIHIPRAEWESLRCDVWEDGEK